MGGYKEYKILDRRERNKIIIKNIIIILMIIIAICSLFITKNIIKNKIINTFYLESSNIDYKVYLKENDFFGAEYLNKDNQYIANLIKYIETNFKYKLEGLEKKITKYSYKIVANVNVEDKTTYKSLYNFSEEISNEIVDKVNSSSITINKQLEIDYNKYNNIINEFVNTYDLDNSNAVLKISMYVNVLDKDNNVLNNTNTPVASLSIPLTTKTVSIDMKVDSIDQNNLTPYESMKDEVYLYAIMILFVIDVILIIKLLLFISGTKDEKGIYNTRIKRIMSNYGSYIQKINNEFDFSDNQILEVKSFEDLLQIKETLNEPILMTDKLSAMETYFFIPSEKIIYVYELKMNNLRKIKEKRYKSIEENIEKDIQEIKI